MQFVIKKANNTGRRSVIAMPLVGIKSDVVNDVVEEAVKENVVVVTSAGKKWMFINS